MVARDRRLAENVATIGSPGHAQMLDLRSDPRIHTLGAPRRGAYVELSGSDGQGAC